MKTAPSMEGPPHNTLTFHENGPNMEGPFETGPSVSRLGEHCQNV